MSLPPLVEPAAELTVDEVRRYSRHLIIPDVGMTGQKRLKNAKVLCVGAGGLGSPALLYLAAAGVGTLGIIDFDVVDESNLQRQIIHGQSDIGRPKAESARDSIREINPLRRRGRCTRSGWTRTTPWRSSRRYDLIVDGTDNFATRYLVNDACVLLGKPYVWGSIYRFDGQASVFWAEHGPCYRCLYPEPPPPGMVPSCAEGGVLGVLCALDRLDPGQRGDQADHRDRRAAGRPADDLRRPGDDLPRRSRSARTRSAPVCGKNPTITELIDYEAFCGAVSDEAQEAAPGLDDHRARAEDHAGRGRGHLPRRRPRAERVRDRVHPRRDADPQGRVHLRRRAGRSCRRTSGSCCTARRGVRSAEAWRS